MRLVELVGVRLALPANNPVLELREAESPYRTLIIYIGAPEAASIHCAIEGIIPGRPLTHDLTASIIDLLGGTISMVVLTSESEGTYFAELHLATKSGPLTLSCRPSDAVALAVRTGAEVFAAESLLESCGELPEEGGASPSSELSEDVLDEFRSFIDSISPEDFE